MKTQLQQIINNDAYSLKAAVAQEALDYDNPEAFFHDLLNYGCACGMISSLIYYIDTRAFFDKHYDEIEGLREEYEDSIGEPIKVNGDLKNFFAWFAFEETTYQLANELGLDF